MKSTKLINVSSGNNNKFHMKYENGFWYVQKFGVWFPAGKTVREALIYKIRMESEMKKVVTWKDFINELHSDVLSL